MNGLDRITSRIQAEAQQEIDAILDAGKAETQRIVDGWRARIDAEARELAEKNERSAAEREERLKSAAGMDARKTILAAKQEMVDKAYELALDKLCKLPENKQVELLSGLLERASVTGTEEAVFSASDRALGQKAVKAANASSGKKLRFAAEAAPIRGGFILRDRNVEVNCAYETLIRLQKADTAGAVAKLLFP